MSDVTVDISISVVHLTAVQVFKAFPYGVMKADFWRYAVMYVYGGLYADIDAISVKPIDEWLDPSCTAVIGLENDVSGALSCVMHSHSPH